MMIDNGRRVRLIIDGVFDGMAGLSRGVVAFVPNLGVRAPTAARAGLLDGDAVRLTITCDERGLCTATPEALA